VTCLQNGEAARCIPVGRNGVDVPVRRRSKNMGRRCLSVACRIASRVLDREATPAEEVASSPLSARSASVVHHLDGMGGWDGCWLWRRGREGDHAALRRFAEYNLYDAVSLRALAAIAYNALVDAIEVAVVREVVPRLAVSGRGDVLYDVSKILMAL
jgi:hypothetical protein